MPLVVLAVLALGALALKIGSNPAGLYPTKPLQARAGETWWIVSSGYGVDPSTLGDVFSFKPGTAQEGGIGNRVFVVRLARDVVFLPGKNVLSARRAHAQ